MRIKHKATKKQKAKHCLECDDVFEELMKLPPDDVEKYLNKNAKNLSGVRKILAVLIINMQLNNG